MYGTMLENFTEVTNHYYLRSDGKGVAIVDPKDENIGYMVLTRSLGRGIYKGIAGIVPMGTSWIPPQNINLDYLTNPHSRKKLIRSVDIFSKTLIENGEEDKKDSYSDLDDRLTRLAVDVCFDDAKNRGLNMLIGFAYTVDARYNPYNIGAQQLLDKTRDQLRNASGQLAEALNSGMVTLKDLAGEYGMNPSKLEGCEQVTDEQVFNAFPAISKSNIRVDYAKYTVHLIIRGLNRNTEITHHQRTRHIQLNTHELADIFYFT
jgi:hypothetical protein